MSDPLSQVDLEGTIALLRRMIEYDRQEFFDMGVNAYVGRCGSVACIGGWAWLLKNATPFIPYYVYSAKDTKDAAWFVSCQDDEDSPLNSLFFPPGFIDYAWVTPAIAIEAIEMFLQTGDVDWDKIHERHVLGLEDDRWEDAAE